MSQKSLGKMLYALITVVITVHLFVYYNLYFVCGLSLAEVTTGYGVPVFGIPVKLWAVVLIELVFAFTLEMTVGAPLSARLAFKAVPPAENKPFITETAVICATVCIMCPLMSLIATFLYNDLGAMSVGGFIAVYLKTVMHNFPLALFSQLFFIQPFVRFLFSRIFRFQRQ